MAAEMDEQPDVIRRLVESADRIRADLDRALPRPPVGIVLVARGSSDAAAVYGRYVLELVSRCPVALAAPSLLTRYGARPRLTGWLAVAVSQSGETPEIVDALTALRAGGAAGVAITNDPSSSLSAAADVTLELSAGRELAVPATKTFTAQVTAFALMAQSLGPTPWSDADWHAVAGSVRDVLDDPAPVAQTAASLADARKLLTVARGMTYAVAVEAALKLAETTGLPSSSYSSADLLHGPIAATGPDVHAIVFAVDGPCLDDVRATTDELHRRDAPVTVVAGDDVVDRFERATATISVPGTIPEALTPLLLVVRAQQLARELALSRDIDPDEPGELEKITPTH